MTTKMLRKANSRRSREFAWFNLAIETASSSNLSSSCTCLCTHELSVDVCREQSVSDHPVNRIAPKFDTPCRSSILDGVAS